MVELASPMLWRFLEVGYDLTEFVRLEVSVLASANQDKHGVYTSNRGKLSKGV